MNEAKAELERRVAERTAELQAEVDARRRIEQTLRASERHWRGMFEASALGIVLVDQRHRIVAANAAFENMVGYSAEELRSMTPRDITHEDDREATEAIIEDVMARRGETHAFEKRYRHKDGRVVWARVSAARTPYAQDDFFGFPAIIEDITERKRVEDALSEAREALIRMTRLRIVGELSASIAHEINQPLSTIVINSNVCLRLMAAAEPDLAGARAALADIVADCKRVSAVTRRVRALFSNATPEWTPVDVNETIRELLALSRHELQRHRVSVQTKLARNLPFVQADRVQLQHVILNLVKNGVESMVSVHDRPRVLTIRSFAEDPDHINVSVADVGDGLAQADRALIFESFYSTKANGMGLGLSISRSMVEAHRGRLWVEDGFPHGAIFSFRLPVTQAPDPSGGDNPASS